MGKPTIGTSCMNVDIFIDTNVLVYAHDALDQRKRRIAQRILNDAWEGRLLAGLSVQVLQEFYATMLRKGGDGLYYRDAIDDFFHWPVVENTKELLRRAMEVHREFKMSFYDANIIAAAQRAGAKELWSEDFNAGQDYGGVMAVNPFEEK